MSRRTQAERDAITVEIGYALFSGGLVAVATFVGVSLPALLLDLSDGWDRGLFRAGAALGGLAFATRVVHVLWRFPRAGEEGRLPPAGPTRDVRRDSDP
ncbi:DUF6332 family protein [Streptomyces sp. NPDC058008]|uniref:DUF6332 family protein n=1 Tax=Streptomyces sp. NPDC058008 TaxID=3346303 RepID=UPI0036EA3CA6